MSITHFLGQPAAWLGPESSSDGVIISSRVRLARNLAGHPFPSRASADVLRSVQEQSCVALRQTAALQPVWIADLETLDPVERAVLVERRLASREHAAGGSGRATAVRLDEQLGVMVNEEDHLRLQALLPGWQLDQAWQAVNRLDSEIERDLAFAYDPRYGYLTACPSNLGTGMRASAMLHLPGLVLMGEMNAVLRGLGKIGLAVRGLWGEGTEALGHVFQVSNQVTLGVTEEQVVSRLAAIVQELAGHEQHARARLMDKRLRALRDHVGRAYGVLAYAHRLSTQEALQCLSGLRLGQETGILKKLDKQRLNTLWLQIQPGHLQRAAGSVLTEAQRDAFRADWVRKQLRRKDKGEA